MSYEPWGRSVITVLHSKKDVGNFFIMYIPLGRMSFIISDIANSIELQIKASLTQTLCPKDILSLILSHPKKAVAFGVFQQSILFPNERMFVSHGCFDIFWGVFQEKVHEINVFHKTN